MTEILATSRRGVLGGAIGAAFVLAIPRAVAQALTGRVIDGATELQPLIAIHPDGRIRIVSLMAEMGQGVATSLPLILAEELDADWEKVEIVQFSTEYSVPPTSDPGLLVTASSRSVRGWYPLLRDIAARGRAQLVAAAASGWRVPADACSTAKSRVIHPDGKTSLDYGALAAKAASMPRPETVVLKRPDQFRLIGKIRQRRDVTAKCDGSAIYASDVQLPGMVHASVLHAPYGSAELTTFDRAKALSDPRVHDMFVIGDTTLVAVARDTWSAFKALEAAAPVYRSTDTTPASSEAYRAALHAGLAQPGRAFAVKGTPPPPSAPGMRRVEAVYDLPFLAHATMEPMSCAAWFRDGQLEMWAPSQAMQRAREVAARAAGLPLEAVRMHLTLLGGGFGRRSESDFVSEAAAIAMKVKAPVRLQWSRQEDMRRDYYRPAYAMRCTGAVDASGEVADYQVTIAGPSIMRSRVAVFDSPRAPIDPTVQSGLVPQWYRLGSTRAAWVEVPTSIPVGYWRSVAHSQNVFAAESFIDELARAAKRDPFDFRQSLMADPRMAKVLERLRILSDWDTPCPKGRARGVSIVSCYESYFGQVVELSVTDTQIQVHQVSNVIDCGLAIQPDTIISQVEGGAVFGLTAALHGEITVADGRPQQSGFEDYRMLTLGETPAMRTEIIPSQASPGGVGETGTPCVAPAMANALFALTGKRLRSLPLQKALFG